MVEMADITLSNGREITFDLTKLKLREYRGLFDPKQKQGDEDEVISRSAGMTLDEYQDLTLYDSKQLVVAFLKTARKPVGVDPN